MRSAAAAAGDGRCPGRRPRRLRGRSPTRPRRCTFDGRRRPGRRHSTCTIVADLYTPERRRRAANPAPAILATNGFGGTKDDSAELGAGVRRRAATCSSPTPASASAAAAARSRSTTPTGTARPASSSSTSSAAPRRPTTARKIDYVIGRDDHDGAPSRRPARRHDRRLLRRPDPVRRSPGIDPRLDTIIPQITWNDLSYSLAPNNTDSDHGRHLRARPGVEKFDWVSAVLRPRHRRTASSTLGSGPAAHLRPCPNFADRVCRPRRTMDATGYADEPRRSRSPATRRSPPTSSKIRIPTFICPGPVRHAVQPQRGRRHLRGAARAGHAGQDAVALAAGHSGGGLGGREQPARTRRRPTRAA